MKQPIAVAWGAGWDSTAMIIEMINRGEEISLITYADTGGDIKSPDPERGEQVSTHEFIPIFTEWLRDRGVPAPVICYYNPKPITTDRYSIAARQVAADLGLNLSDSRISQLSRLYGNMVANETLPGIVFGPKSCSIKWKLEAQEPT